MQAMISPITLRWPRRPRRVETPCSFVRVWESRCRGFRVICRESKFHKGPEGWAVLRWRTVEGNAAWDLVSYHRRRKAAFRAAERAAHDPEDAR